MNYMDVLYEAKNIFMKYVWKSMEIETLQFDTARIETGDFLSGRWPLHRYATY